MYSLEQVARGLTHPSLIFREINRLYYRRLYTREYNTDGIDIFNEDWDNLLILDACRYGMVENLDLPGQLESRTSRASNTVGFLKSNFGGKRLLDTVYVTANPQLYRHQDEINTELHNVVDVWKEDGWDEESGTVLPETVNGYALEAASDYPHKRLIIHYMQPHYPFLGSETEFDKHHLETAKEDEPNFWYRMLYDELNIETETVWELYRANLQRVAPCVRELLKSLDGKTVVTSDHGNMVGERSFPVPFREWGHPHGIYTPELVTVPWLEHDEGPRRRIVAGEHNGRTSRVDSTVVKRRLRELGYS